MTNIKIGTSSWTDPTLVKDGNFYPPEAKSAEARLKFYASRFPLVEVDSTYYFPPSEKNSVLWIERTPAHFTFNIKAYSLLTNHPTRPNSLYKDIQTQMPPEALAKRFVYRDAVPDDAVDEVWQRFRDALMPLHSAGKLGAVLFQFPQWFTISRKNKAYIEECVARLPDYRVAVEFRHTSWLKPENTEETLSFLEERNLPLVCVDMPQGFDSSVPPIAAATADDAPAPPRRRPRGPPRGRRRAGRPVGPPGSAANAPTSAASTALSASRLPAATHAGPEPSPCRPSVCRP